MRKDLLEQVDASVFAAAVVGCPDPHVERWCFADPVGFEKVVGSPPPPDPGKCERDLYERLLRETLDAAGIPILIDEMEVAPDIVDASSLSRAGKTQRSLGRFVDDLRGALALAGS